MTGNPSSPPTITRPHDRRVLVEGGFVITMDAAREDFVGDVLLHGGRIEALGPQLGDEGGENVERIDARGSVVLPGLVDSHVHAWEGAIRGLAPDADFNQYMALTHGGVAPAMTPEDIAAGQAVTAAQALNGGVTTIIDNSHNARTPEHSDAALEVLRGAGLRAVHAVGPPTAGSADAPKSYADLVRLRGEWADGSGGLVTIRMFDINPTVEGWRFASDNGFDTVCEMGMWIPDLDELFASDLLGPGHTLNHCTGLRPDQWKRIADSGAAINVVPRSDAQFGTGGFVPILQANRLGIQEGISSDNEVAYGQDLFAEMRALITVQRGLSFQAQFAGEPDVPAHYGPREALRAATLGGALNARASDRIGSLTVGKQADLILVDLDSVALRPLVSMAGAVANFAGIADVSTVLVNGVVKKWGGTLVDVDYDRIVARAEQSRGRLLDAIGLSLDDARFDRPLHPHAPKDDAVDAVVRGVGV